MIHRPRRSTRLQLVTRVQRMYHSRIIDEQPSIKKPADAAQLGTGTQPYSSTKRKFALTVQVL